MANHSSATVREHTPHANRISRTNTIVNALKRRVQAVLNDNSIDPQSRAIIWRSTIRGWLDWCGAPMREKRLSICWTWTKHLRQTMRKIEALIEMICRASDEPETKSAALLVLMSTIENSSHPKALVRGEKVMLDRDLAELYQVQTKALNQAVRRNRDRFPADFMFQLSEKEVVELNRSQLVTGSQFKSPKSFLDSQYRAVATWSVIGMRYS